MTTWKDLIARKELFAKIELNGTEVILHLAQKYVKPELIMPISNAIMYLYSVSRDFQNKFRRPKKSNALTLQLQAEHGYHTGVDVLNALSNFATSHKSKAKAAAEQLAQAKPIKNRKDVRAALKEGTLFAKVELKGSQVFFSPHPDFLGNSNQRLINGVLASLRRSSKELQRTIYDLKNLNREPFLGLTKTHGYSDCEAVLKALIAAQIALETSQQVSPELEAIPQQEVITQQEVTPVVAAPVLEDANSLWDFADLSYENLDLDAFGTASHYSSDNSIEMLLAQLPTPFEESESMLTNKSRSVLFRFEDLTGAILPPDEDPLMPAFALDGYNDWQGSDELEAAPYLSEFSLR